MTSIRDDLRSLPLLIACGVVLLAVVVLVIRCGALVVFVIADVAERTEAAVTGAAGISPIAASVVFIVEEGLYDRA